MLLAMTSTTISLLGSFVLLQSTSTISGDDLSAIGAYDGNTRCTNDVIGLILSELPECRPRDTIVELPLPDNAAVVEVIPSHVVVPRCSGVCHQGNLYHKCVPSSSGRAQHEFQVMFRKSNFDPSGALECARVSVETHTRCKCGCDLQSASCSPKQDYDHHFCKCRCRNSDERAKCNELKKTKFWDEKSCQCVCRMDRYKECSTGFIYDAIDTCECIRESSMNKAGVEVVVALVVVIVVLVIAVAALSWKLMQSYRQRRTSRRTHNGSEHVPQAGGATTSVKWPEPDPNPESAEGQPLKPSQ